MKKIKWYVLAVMVLLGLTYIGLSSWQRFNTQVTEKIKFGNLTEAIYGLGTITPTHSYQLKIGQMGLVSKIFVREGEVVKKGSPLISIDQGHVVTFAAPFSGTVTAVPFKAGETVFPQVALLSMMDLKDRYVVVSLEQEGALRVRAGLKAKMSVESLQGKSFEGQVRAIFPGENQFLVHIDFKSLPAEIIPGMTGDVAIEVAHRDHVLMVPVNAIQAGVVRVIRSSAVKKIPIVVGAVDGRWAEVVSGDLQEGDEAILGKKIE